MIRNQVKLKMLDMKKHMPSLEKSLKPVIDAIKDNKKVTFFVGAGISTAAGIPDFRSPETGLYSNLEKLNLPFAEAVFDIDYFREAPEAFFTLAEELYPGKFKPTKFHFLLKLIQDKNRLHRVYTQNIDTLERMAGVHEKYIVEAHGSFAKHHCIDCAHEIDKDSFEGQMRNKNENNGIPTCPDCQGYVKPDIVFFGEQLPSLFFEMWDKDADEVEIAIVAGTSLTVYPFAGLPSEIPKNSYRILVNKECVGDFKTGNRKKDIIALTDCEKYASVMAEMLGWKSDFEKLIEEYDAKFKANNKDADALAATISIKDIDSKIKDELLENNSITEELVELESTIDKLKI